MAHLDFKFAVNGMVSQRVHILTNETPEEFFKKIETGDYLTSISSKTILDLNNDFKEVGIIEDQQTLDDTEYVDMEME